MKTSGSYASVLRGISQQPAHLRSEGQHAEQVNMVPDPVEGLARRWGSQFQAELPLSSLVAAEVENAKADTASWTTFSYTNAGNDYTVLIRRGARVSTALPPLLVYNRTTKAFINVTTSPLDTKLNELLQHGAAAVTNVGRFLFIAGNGSTPSATVNTLWGQGAPSRLQAALWVRGGAYSRTYRVTLTRSTGLSYSFSYTTPASSYPGVLDTSDIPYSDPEYSKKVSERVNAYNNAVTQWIGTAAAAIQPEAIAVKLRDAAIAILPVGASPTAAGSHVSFVDTSAISVDDGGDGSLLRAIAQTVPSVDHLSPNHWAGKVVKVQPANSPDYFFMKAEPKIQGAAGFTQVTWVEGAGSEVSIDFALFCGVVYLGSFYLASSPTKLTDYFSVQDVPVYAKSRVGDTVISPPPAFIGKKITYLGTFQDRLLIGAGSTLCCSKTADYLNFFRDSMLTLPATDALEIRSQGEEDDVLRYSLLYNRDLVIFGDDRQYAVSGRTALTPTSANMVPISAHKGATTASAVAAGDYVFYAKAGVRAASLNQIQQGLSTESTESFPVSSQISSYIKGKPIEITWSASPTSVYMRATGDRQSVYVFNYLDNPQGRQQDAWGRWEFHPILGPVMGIQALPEGLLVFHLRDWLSDSPEPVRLIAAVADLIPFEAGLSNLPYLDSNSFYTGRGNAALVGDGSVWKVALDSQSSMPFSGVPRDDWYNGFRLTLSTADRARAIIGVQMDSYVTLTNPYIKDDKDKAITTARLTVSKILADLKNSSGFRTLVKTIAGTQEDEHSARIVDSPDNLIGREVVTNYAASISVGREAKAYELTIKADSWKPLTITLLEWVGQFFNRTRRIS